MADRQEQFKEVQSAYSALAECQRKGGRVLSIHSRGAEARVVELLALTGDVGTPVLHWFSGGIGTLETAVRAGCWFSVGPAMLAGEKGRHLASRMPMERVLPETDGPFAKVRGASLMPWQAMDVSRALAELWRVTQDEARDQLRNNLRHLLANDGRGA